MSTTRVMICPYCGQTQPETGVCRACSGIMEPLSRQATQNAMGPWFIRDTDRPFTPGCSYETLVRLVERGKVTKYTIVRGPTTRQFWTIARRVAGIAHLLGYCHQCNASVDPSAHGCHACGEQFGAWLDRNYLGVAEIRPLPGEPGFSSSNRSESGGSLTGGSLTGGSLTGGSLTELESETARNASPALEWAPSTGLSSSSEEPPVSSFLSDSEAQGSDSALGDGAFSSAVNVKTIELSTEPQVNSQPAPEPAISKSPSSSVTTTTRALKRRIDQLQRTNRILMIAGAGAVLIAIVASIEPISRAIDDKSQQNESESTLIDTNDAISGESTGFDPASDLEDFTTGPDSEAMDQEVTGPPSPAHAAQAATPPDTPEYLRAEALFLAAQDSSRALNDRINDCEQALRIFETLTTTLEPDNQPAELSERIEEAETELERLKLRRFFDE